MHCQVLLMTLDIFVACIFLLMIFLGWRSGILKQVWRVGAALAVILCTAPVSVVVREIVFPGQHIASVGFEVASMFLAAVIIYVGLSLAGWILIKALRRSSDALSHLDSLGGAALGSIKAALLVYVVALLVTLLYGVFERVDPEDRLHMRDGHVTAFVRDHDFIAPWRFPELKRLHSALRVAEYAMSQRGARALQKHPEAQDLLKRDAFKSLLGDGGVLHAAKKDHYPLTLASEKVRKLLGNKSFLKALESIDWQVLETQLDVKQVVAKK